MNQPTLFDQDDDDDWPLPDPTANETQVRRDATDTSRLAALRAFPRSGTARKKVLDHLGRAGEAGDTDERIQDILRMGSHSECPRRLELVAGGWVEDSGKRRRTRTGASAIVWRLTEAGGRRWRARLMGNQEDGPPSDDS